MLRQPWPLCLRALAAAVLSAGLMVLAAALVTAGGNALRVTATAGPIHPAAEITPNAMPRTCHPPVDVHTCAQPTGDGADVGPFSATVAEPVTAQPDLTSWAAPAPVDHLHPRISEQVAGGRAPPARDVI